MTARCIVPQISGRWIHHNDCFWCQHFEEHPAEIRNKKVIRISEHCGLHKHAVPPPYSVNRCCENYAQRNCGCSKCITIVIED